MFKSNPNMLPGVQELSFPQAPSWRQGQPPHIPTNPPMYPRFPQHPHNQGHPEHHEAFRTDLSGAAADVDALSNGFEGSGLGVQGHSMPVRQPSLDLPANELEEARWVLAGQYNLINRPLEIRCM